MFPRYHSRVSTWATWQFHCQLRDHCTWHGENKKNSRSRVLLGKLIFPKSQGPSTEDNSSTVSQEIPQNFWKRSCISRIHSSQSTDPILSQINAAQKYCPPNNAAISNVTKTCKDLLMCNRHLELSTLCFSSMLKNLDINYNNLS